MVQPFLSRQTPKDLMIGVLTLLGIGLMVAMFVFIHPRSGNYKEKLRIRFTDITGLKKGTVISWAGKPVGEVEVIQQVPQARQLKPDAYGDYYLWEVDAAVDSSVVIYNTDEVTTVTKGLFGERVIEITPVQPPKGKMATKIKEGQVLYAESTDIFTVLQHTIQDISAKLGNALDVVTDVVEYNREPLHDALCNLSFAGGEVGAMVKEINQRDMVASMDAGMRHFNSILKALDQPEVWNRTLHNVDSLSGSLAQLGGQLTSSWPLIAQALQNFGETMGAFKNIAQRIDRGEGFIGKLVTSDALYYRIMHIAEQADDLLGSIGQHGLLFNLNRGWQREQTSRQRLANQFRAPDQLRAYFTGEMDDLSVAVQRLTEQLRISCEERQNCCLQGNPELEEATCDVLERVGRLEKDLDLVSQALQPGC